MSEILQQEEYCLDCKTTLQGEFCHRCGQKKLNTHQDSFLHTMIHFIGDFVHFDSQIFRTAFPLLFKPGFLVNEYFKGKRTRYLPPIRMYVFLSFLFFFLTFSLSDFNSTSESIKDNNDIVKFNLSDNDDTAKNLSWNQLSDSLDKYNVSEDSGLTFGMINVGSAAQYDSVQQSLPENKKDNWLVYAFKYKGFMVRDRFVNGDRNEFISDILHSFTHNFPKVLFFYFLYLHYFLKYFTEKDITLNTLFFLLHFIISSFYLAV